MIFYLSEDPVRCYELLKPEHRSAQLVHVMKVILQIHREDDFLSGPLHKVYAWGVRSEENYNWLVEHAKLLQEELGDYRDAELLMGTPASVNLNPFDVTKFPQTFPVMFRRSSPSDGYLDYYKFFCEHATTSTKA